MTKDRTIELFDLLISDVCVEAEGYFWLKRTLQRLGATDDELRSLAIDDHDREDGVL